MMSGGVMLLFFIWYAVAGFVSAGKVLAFTFALDYYQSVGLSGLFIMVYTALGGFLAVSWVDVFQGLLMFFALLVVPMVVYGEVPDLLSDAVLPVGYWDIGYGVSVVGVLSKLAWGLGYMGQPHIIGRFMAIKRVEDLPVARRICIAWMSAAMLCAVGVGLVGGCYYHTPRLEDGEVLFLLLARRFFAAWGYAVLLCAVLSSIMSTVACLFLMGASALVEDVYGTWCDAQRPMPIQWHRLAVGMLGLIAMVLACQPGMKVMEAVAFPWCGLGASFGPVILVSLYWRGLTAWGAMTGMMVGGGTVCLWEVARQWGAGWLQGDELVGLALLPAFVLSVVSMVWVSYLRGKRGRHFVVDCNMGVFIDR